MADSKKVSDLESATSVVASDLFDVVQDDPVIGLVSRKAELSLVKRFFKEPAASIELNIVSGEININAADVGPFFCVLTENSILKLPSNGVNGQSIEVDFIQDGTGSRSLNVSAYSIPVDATLPVQPTAASSRSLMLFRLCGSTWCITSFLKFSS